VIFGVSTKVTPPPLEVAESALLAAGKATRVAEQAIEMQKSFRKGTVSNCLSFSGLRG
jgi:hypothetical protein